MDDNLIDLGTEIWINLCVAGFPIERFIAALEATTTLTELTVSFREYKPTLQNYRRVIEPLCHCISNLRRHNGQHPLRKLRVDNYRENGMQEGVFAQFLVAAKQFGIFDMELCDVFDLPVQILVDFCRDNKSLESLELDNVRFSSGGNAALPLPLNNGPPNNSVDWLILSGVSFEDSTAATVFAALVTQVNVLSLSLGQVTAEDVNEEDDNDAQITERILSELKMPSAEQLSLYADCRMEHFKAALDAGTTTVTYLNVFIDCDEDDVTARLELLASFIRRAVKLDSLTIGPEKSGGFHVGPQLQLFQALEACATVTEIHVFLNDHQSESSPDEVQLREKIASRNRELDRFATNPGTYPTKELLELMRQCDNCSTGRYMLARRLPGVLSFPELHAMHLSRRRRKRKAQTEFHRNSACNIS